MESAIFNAAGGKTTVIKGDSIVQTDGGKTNTSNAAGNTVVDGTKSTATTARGLLSLMVLRRIQIQQIKM